MPEVVMVSRMLLWHSRKNSTGTAMMMNVTAAAALALNQITMLRCEAGLYHIIDLTRYARKPVSKAFALQLSNAAAV